MRSCSFTIRCWISSQTMKTLVTKKSSPNPKSGLCKKNFIPEVWRAAAVKFLEDGLRYGPRLSAEDEEEKSSSSSSSSWLLAPLSLSLPSLLSLQ